MSVSVIIRITAQASKFEELQKRLVANLPQTREFAGNELVRLVAPRQEPDVLLLIEEWATLDAFKAYKAWRDETGSSALRPDLIAEPPEVIVAEILF